MDKCETTIWSSTANVDDYRDFLIEEHPDVVDEHEKQQLVDELNQTYLDDELENLKRPLDNDILVIANLGLWNGRRTGYRYLGRDLTDIFEAHNDETRYYVDRYNVRATGAHHDGVNHYTFRELRPDVERDNPLVAAIAAGRPITSQFINRYTRSLRPHVAAVYGC